MSTVCLVCVKLIRSSSTCQLLALNSQPRHMYVICSVLFDLHFIRYIVIGNSLSMFVVRMLLERPNCCFVVVHLTLKCLLNICIILKLLLKSYNLTFVLYSGLQALWASFCQSCSLAESRNGTWTTALEQSASQDSPARQ